MNIIFEDKDLLVVEKPAGIATQSAGVGVPDLETELMKYRKNKGEVPEIYVVHRLDQPVAGLLVFAKTKEAAAALTKELTGEAFTKTYEATVFKTERFVREGRLTDYLVKEKKGNLSRIAASPNEAGAKEARLSYETVCEDEKTATLKVHLETGRHHQIRLQFSNAGMPLVGDLKYGSNESIAYSKEVGVKFVALRATELKFTHPKSKKEMRFLLNAEG